MADRYLMTHSLLRSWLYTMKENPYEDATTERDPMAEFLQVLRREPTPVTEAMERGNEFEHLCMNICDGVPTILCAGDSEPQPIHEHKWYDAANTVAGIVHGAQFQFKAKRNVSVAGMDFLLYGRLDALRAGAIYDIKFSSKYERGKFVNDTQHPVYLEIVPEARRFIYVISNGTDVWTEAYERADTRSILPEIADFTEWLGGMGLMDVYKEKWLAL